MKKYAKYLLISGLVAAFALAAAGCGEEKKAEPPKPATTATATTEKKAETKAPVKLGPPKEGEHYRYAAFIKDASETVEMTPELDKIVNDFYNTYKDKFSPKEKGKMTNLTKVKAREGAATVHLTILGIEDNPNVKFNLDSGSPACREQKYVLKINYDQTAKKVKSVKGERRDLTPEAKKWVTTQLFEKKY